MNELLNRAMRLLSQRDHSEFELRRKLVAQPFSARGNWQKRTSIENRDPHAIEQVIAYCYQHGWLDDSRFATSYINSSGRKGYGAQRIRSELMQKGIDKERIQTAFEISKINWFLLAREVAQGKFGETLPVEWKEKAKVQRYLLCRGFFQEEIQAIYNDFDE
ncbi:MAG: regulatory protein RecX [Yersinia sp. (in: enterobacteria)]